MGSGRYGPGHIGRVIERRKDHHADCGAGRPEPLDDVEAVIVLKPHVEQHDVGLVFAGLTDRFLSRCSLSTDPDVGVAKETDQALTHDFVVVHDEKFQCHGGESSPAERDLVKFL